MLEIHFSIEMLKFDNILSKSKGAQEPLDQYQLVCTQQNAFFMLNKNMKMKEEEEEDRKKAETSKKQDPARLRWQGKKKKILSNLLITLHVSKFNI